MPDKRKNRDATAPHRQRTADIKPVFPTVPPMPVQDTRQIDVLQDILKRLADLETKNAEMEQRLSKFDGGPMRPPV